MLDQFWGKRYFLFERFDEGIKIDEESWERGVIPEIVAEHIAGKVRCETILDAFSGVGSIAIKLSNTCVHVIGNDPEPLKLKCLANNSKVYNVDNIELTNYNFLSLEGLKLDVILAFPPLKKNTNI